jgi:hypothetical protein
MQSENSDAWFGESILTGLQRLICLGLEGQPAMDLIPGTARAWRQVLWPGHAWIRERDEARFAQAFTNLMSNVRRWPVPAQFLEALPKFESAVPKLRKECNPEVRECAMRHIAELLGEILPPKVQPWM